MGGAVTTEPTQRVAPPIFPDRWDRPARPGDDALPSVQDAYRQTSFQLGDDLRLLHEGMNLQLQIVKDSYPGRFRTYPLAAGLMLWSRAFLAISDAAAAVTRASYGSVAPLARMACECLAAAHQAHTEEHAMFLEWLSESLRPDERLKAVAIGLGGFFAGSTIAADADFGAVYRATSELSRPHFGVSLALTAPESNVQKLAVTFADQSFHLGWAQLTLGWLLTLCDVQLRLAQTPGAPYAITEQIRGDARSWTERLRRLLAAPDRCRVEELMEGGGRRWLITNFRRQAGGAPRRLLL
jgi:hypothetical protein